MRIPFVSPKIHGLLHAGVTVTDFEAAVKWYHENFNCLLVSEQWIKGEDAEALAELYGTHGLTIRLGFMRTPDGGVLEIFEFQPKGEKIPLEWNRPGWTHACISVRNVPKIREKLESRGVEFVTDTQHTAGADWAFLKDPDGNLLEIMDLGVAQRLPLKWLGWTQGLIMKMGKCKSYYE